MYLTVDVYIMYNHMFNVISNDLSDKVMFVQRFLATKIVENIPPMGGTICTEHHFTRGHYVCTGTLCTPSVHNLCPTQPLPRITQTGTYIRR